MCVAASSIWLLKMPPRKRKADAQPKLEEIVDDDVKVLKSKAGQNDKAKVEPKKEAAVASKEDEDDDQDMFAKRRAKKTGVSSPPKKKQTTAPAEPDHGSSDSGIWVNRAPVLTLWVSAVAQQQGFSKEAGKVHRHLSLLACSACCYRIVQACMSVNAEQRLLKLKDQTMVNVPRKHLDCPQGRRSNPLPSLSVTPPEREKVVCVVQEIPLARQ